MDIQAGFATTEDGARLYWRRVGTGPVIACCNGVGVSIFFWKYLTAHFADRYSVVCWDYRAHGRSDRRLPGEGDLSIERHARDLGVVLDAAVPDGGPALLIGHSMGCQVILEVMRDSAERVVGLVPILGSAGKVLHTFFDFPLSPLVFRALHRASTRLGETANELVHPILESPLAWEVTRRFQLVDPWYAQQQDMLRYMDHLATLDQTQFLTAVLAADRHDAWDLLPTLDRPLLVIAGERDSFTPLWVSERMVEQTPGAELLVLAQASHAALIEQPETINHRLERFIHERLPSAFASRAQPGRRAG